MVQCDDGQEFETWSMPKVGIWLSDVISAPSICFNWADLWTIWKRLAWEMVTISEMCPLNETLIMPLWWWEWEADTPKERERDGEQHHPIW